MGLRQRVGNLLRRLRIEAGLTQEGMEARTGVHRTYVGDVERGEKRITIETLDKILRGLGVSLAEFFVLLEPEAGTAQEPEATGLAAQNDTNPAEGTNRNDTDLA